MVLTGLPRCLQWDRLKREATSRRLGSHGTAGEIPVLAVPGVSVPTRHVGHAEATVAGEGLDRGSEPPQSSDGGLSSIDFDIDHASERAMRAMRRVRCSDAALQSLQGVLRERRGFEAAEDAGRLRRDSKMSRRVVRRSVEGVGVCVPTRGRKGIGMQVRGEGRSGSSWPGGTHISGGCCRWADPSAAG